LQNDSLNTKYTKQNETVKIITMLMMKFNIFYEKETGAVNTRASKKNTDL